MEARRLALSGDQATLRLRYEEVMRWVNPPWDPFSRRVDPRPEEASVMREGSSKIHIDLTGQTVIRWAALQAGAPPILRVKPKYTPAPATSDDPKEDWSNRKQYEKIGRAHV
jgi:hypothetical protein